MDRWLQIILGTLFSSVGVFIFYLIFERFVKSKLRGSNIKEAVDGVERIQLRVKTAARAGLLGAGHGEEEEMEQLVYEEFDTEDHEVLAIVLENEKVTVGVSLFLSDRIVEYYWAPFPDCCVRHTSDADVAVRSFVTCVAAWAEKWTLATCVNILAQDEAVVRNIGTPNSELARKASQFESRHEFRLYTQWTENYVCDEVSSDELWAELISVARQLLASSGSVEATEAASVWSGLPVQHWKRRRIQPHAEDFHLGVPHPGQLTPPSPGPAVTDTLVSL